MRLKLLSKRFEGDIYLMAQNDRISDFVKSGPRRLRDAEELMEAPTMRGKRRMRIGITFAPQGV